MANAQLGSAYVSIFPVMKGFRKAVTNELGAAGKQGASQFQDTMTRGGRTSGQTLATQFTRAFTGSTSSLGNETLTALQANVTKAEGAYSASMGKMRDAAGQLRVAQTRLNELQESGKASATQIARAEEQVASALRKTEAAAQTADAKYRALAQAQNTLNQATKEYASATSGATATAATGWEGVKQRISGMASSLASNVGPGLENLKTAFSATFSVLGTAATAAGTAIASGLVSQTSAAISRMDTINNFPKIMASYFGYGAEESASAVKLISDELDTLPLRLNDVLSNMQQFLPSLSRLGYSADDAAKFTLGLSESLLAAGADTVQVQSTILQLSQAMARGKFDGAEMNTVFTNMSGVMNKMAQDFLGTGASVEELRAALKSGTVSTEDFAGYFVTNMDTSKEAAEDMTQGVGTALYKLQTGFQKADVSIMAPFAEDITSFAVTAKADIETAGTVIGEQLGRIRNNTDGAGTTFSGMIPILGALVGAFAPLLANLPVIGTLFGGLASAGAPVVAAVGAIIGVFIGMWTNSENLRNSISHLWERIQEAAGILGESSAFHTAVTTAGNVFAWIMGRAGDLLAIFINVFADSIPMFGQIFENVFNLMVGIVNGFIDAWKWAKQAIPDAIEWIKQHVTALGDKFTSFKNRVSETIGNVIDTIKGLPGRILSAIGNLGSLLYNTGKDLIQGLINGILSKIAGIGDTITSGLGNAVSKAKSFLGIASPSKLMAKQVGAPLAAGVAQGVTNATPKMLSSIDNDLAKVEHLAYNVPVNWAARAKYNTAGTMSTGAAFGGKVVNQTVNVRATDPNSVLAVLESRQRAALGV